MYADGLQTIIISSSLHAVVLHIRSFYTTDTQKTQHLGCQCARTREGKNTQNATNRRPGLSRATLQTHLALGARTLPRKVSTLQKRPRAVTAEPLPYRQGDGSEPHPGAHRRLPTGGRRMRDLPHRSIKAPY